MTDSEDAIDRAIEDYKQRVQAEAELARGDLAEIEDHLRSLVGELRHDGMPIGRAVAEAARRLGEPRSLAREHARVHPVFGAKLSRLRAYSAVALLVLTLGLSLVAYPHATLRIQIELGFCAIVTLALALRLSWARPVVLAAFAFSALQLVVFELAVGGIIEPMWLLVDLGLVAFVMPWRRRELTGAGWTLALQVWSYSVASMCMNYVYTDSDGSYLMIAPLAMVSAFAAVVATCGVILRARWGALASLVAAGALAVAAIQILGSAVPHQ